MAQAASRRSRGPSPRHGERAGVRGRRRRRRECAAPHPDPLPVKNGERERGDIARHVVEDAGAGDAHALAIADRRRGGRRPRAPRRDRARPRGCAPRRRRRDPPAPAPRRASARPRPRRGSRSRRLRNRGTRRCRRRGGWRSARRFAGGLAHRAASALAMMSSQCAVAARAGAGGDARSRFRVDKGRPSSQSRPTKITAGPAIAWRGDAVGEVGRAWWRRRARPRACRSRR